MTATWRRRLAAAPTVARLVVAYVVLSGLKHIVPLPTLAQWAWQDARRARDYARERRIVSLVGWLRRSLRREDDCLPSSLLLYRELSRLGADPRLAVGFRRRGEQVEGHAWVLVDGRVVPGEAQVEPFLQAFQFGQQGTLLDDGHGLSATGW